MPEQELSQPFLALIRNTEANTTEIQGLKADYDDLKTVPTRLAVHDERLRRIEESLSSMRSLAWTILVLLIGFVSFEIYQTWFKVKTLSSIEQTSTPRATSQPQSLP